MNRRRFLALTGVAIATAGCIGDDRTAGDDSGSETPASETPTPDTPTPSTPGRAATVEISAPSVQAGAVVTTSPDSIGVSADAGQYLLVDASVTDGEAPEGAAFALQTGDAAYEPIDSRLRLYRDGTWGADYRQEDGAGTLAFALPETVPADDARVSWPGGEWALPESARERLASPTPSFDVAFEAPDAVAPDETPSLTVAVTNEGDVAGRCPLALNRVGPRIAYAPVRDVVLDIQAGETATREWDGEAPQEDRDVTYHLHAVGEKLSRTIDPTVETA